MTRSERTLRIAQRFNGPPTSGNGGYVCGEIARSIAGAARVRLRVPPPLDTDLRIAPTADGVGLFDGEQTIGEGWPDALDLTPPPSVPFAEAEQAARDFRGFEEHVFPSCFVCGPERGEGDGLRLFPGPVDDPDRVATPWVPDASLAGPDGRVDPVFVWAALDCPGAFAFVPPPDVAVLLGELTVRIDAPIEVGDRCVVLGWTMAEEGRKHTTGTAVFDGQGRCCGVGRGIWIERPLG